ncbi:MAG: AAA family ATPase [bacterium]|nr:AAA family ATPase [bacterium]
MYKRLLDLGLWRKASCFLWGARKTGKTTLLKSLFPKARYYDLLLSDEYSRFIKRPSLLREECEAEGLTGETQKEPVIIDEVQKIPTLLNEIHWLIENKRLRFILCGSSARKLKRGHANLLGGRAIRYELYPLVYPEIRNFSLIKALNNGLIPDHYSGSVPARLLQAYVGDYLKEEIAAESLVRNVPVFSRFLEIAALSNGEMVNFNNIARECGVSAPSIKEYFQILEDTLTGRFLPAYRKKMKRRLVHAPKFYMFDIGAVSYLTKRGLVEPGSELFGKAFEHFIYCELAAHSAYSGLFYPVSYWRTASQFEVDFILGEHEVAVEVKASAFINENHLRGMKAFQEEYPARHYLIVSLDPKPRRIKNIEVLPWPVFLERLWSGRIIT